MMSDFSLKHYKKRIAMLENMLKLLGVEETPIATAKVLHQTSSHLEKERENTVDCLLALHEAIHQHNLAMLHQALEYGTDPNQRDRLGRTALHYAAKEGDVEAMTALLIYGSDPNIKDFGDEGLNVKEIVSQNGFLSAYHEACRRAQKCQY